MRHKVQTWEHLHWTVLASKRSALCYATGPEAAVAAGIRNQSIRHEWSAYATTSHRR